MVIRPRAERALAYHGMYFTSFTTSISRITGTESTLTLRTVSQRSL